MKSFAGIAVSTLILFASAPAFAHGGHAGMNGMNGMNGANNPTYTVTKNTQTPTNNSWNKINNTSTKTGMTDHHSFGHKLFLRTEERILAREVLKLEFEEGKLLVSGSNPTRLARIEKELAAKLSRLSIIIAQQNAA